MIVIRKEFILTLNFENHIRKSVGIIKFKL